MTHAIRADRAATQERRNRRRHYYAVQTSTSLACCWSHRGLVKGRTALALEPVAEQGRVLHEHLTVNLRGELTGLVLRYGVDLSQTRIDEDLTEMQELCCATWDLEHRQAREIAASVLDQLRARNAAAQANGLLESVQGHGVVGQWAA